MPKSTSRAAVAAMRPALVAVPAGAVTCEDPPPRVPLDRAHETEWARYVARIGLWSKRADGKCAPRVNSRELVRAMRFGLLVGRVGEERAYALAPARARRLRAQRGTDA